MRSAWAAVAAWTSCPAAEAVWAVTPVCRRSDYRPDPHRPVVVPPPPPPPTSISILWALGSPTRNSILEAAPAVPWSRTSDKWATHYWSASANGIK